MGHGIVYDQDGKEYRYRDKQKAKLDPNWNWLGFSHEEVVVK